MFHRTLHDQLSMLELADSFDEDEFGNFSYVFNTKVGTLKLYISTSDGDTAVELTVPKQQQPVVDLHVVGCEDILCVNDKRGQYIEVIGQNKVEDYSRGKLEKTSGFRIRLKPFVSIEPFYRADGQ